MLKITSDLEKDLNALDKELIKTTKTTHDILLKKAGTDAYTLYHFYCYTAKWQSQQKENKEDQERYNQIKATTGFVAKGLGWGEHRVRKAKKQLIKHNFIKEIRARNKETGKVIGWYIRVKYIPSEKTTLIENHWVDDGKGNTEGLVINNTTTHAKHGIESSVESENKNVPSMKRTIPPFNQNRHWAVEYWNNLPDPSNLSQPKRKSKRPGPAQLPRHRNPNTKSYKDAARLIDQLQQGTFLGNGTKTRRRYIKAFFHGKNMPLALATSTWSNEMIEIGLKRTARVYYLGGWKPRSLADLIYNPHSKAEYYSFFFDAVYYWKKVEKRIENQDTETEMSTTVIYLPKPSQRDRMNKKVRLEDIVCDISDELELPEETTLNGA